MFDMCTSIIGNGIALIASCRETPCCVSPAGFTIAPSTESMRAWSASSSAPSWFDWMISIPTPSSAASASSFWLISASVIVP